MSDDPNQTLIVTPAALLKHLHPKVEIVHIIRFLQELVSALDVSSLPEISTARAIWTPAHNKSLTHAEQHFLTYNYRKSVQFTDLSNDQHLYPTDIASLLDEIKFWLNIRSQSIAGSHPAVVNLIRTIRDHELLERAKVSSGDALPTDSAVQLEADRDGYSEKLLGPAGGFSLINESDGFDRLKEIARILLLAAAEFEKAITGKTTVDIASLQKVTEHLKSQNPVLLWPIVKTLAEEFVKAYG